MKRAPVGTVQVAAALLTVAGAFVLGLAPGCGPTDLPDGILPTLISYEPTHTSTGTTGPTTNSTSGTLVPLEPPPSRLSMVLVSSAPKPFTAAELELVKAALRPLPDLFLQTVELYRASQGESERVGTLAGQATSSPDRKRSKITLFDPTFSGGFSNTYPPEYYTQNEAGTLLAKDVIVHEFTHHAQMRKSDGTVEYTKRFFYFTPITTDWSRQFGWSLKSDWEIRTDNRDWVFDRSRCAERVSSYAITLDPGEDISESVAFFFTDGIRLRSASADRASFVQQRFGLTRPPDPARTRPPDREYEGPDCPGGVASKTGWPGFCQVVYRN